MSKIVECIPNISEGRDAGLLAELASAAQSVPGATLWDYSADASHHRSVYTLAGSPAAVAEAAFRLCRLAARRIDLRAHKGEHPRVGAADVVPFVPLRDMSMAECAELARAFGRRVWEELGVPVTLYEEAASAPHRQNLAEVRRGGFEGLAEKLKDPLWRPDYGDAPHPAAGLVAVGARRPLVAFNVNLATGDLGIAKDIAKAVRASSGGLPFCKAIGVKLAERGLAQVSMNLTNYEETPVYEAFEAVKAEAAKRGVEIAGSQIIGLAPAAALVACAEQYLMLENFDPARQVLDARLAEFE